MQNNIVIVTEAIHKVNRRKRLLQKGLPPNGSTKKDEKNIKKDLHFYKGSAIIILVAKERG